MVNYEEAIRKPFTDFKKLIIGIILSIIPIVNFTVVSGFALESSGLGKTKPSKKMPEWKDWTYLFIKGLAAFAIRIIYMIPALLVIAVAVGLAAGNVINALLGTVITPEMMGQMGTGETTGEQLQMMFRENWYLILPALIKVAPMLIVGLILLLVASFITPMAVLNYMKNKRFSAAFDLGVILGKAFTGKYVLAWLAVMIVSIILGAILSLVPILGPAIVAFVVGVMSYSLFGQVYRKV